MLRYVAAPDWQRLAIAVTSSIPQTHLDEMIILIDENKSALRTFRGVHPIKFRDADDIRRKLGLAAGPASTLNPAALPFVPPQARGQANDSQPSVETSTEEANEADDPIQEDPEEEDTESPPEGVDVAAMIGSTEVTRISEEDLAKQHDAAKTLQSSYRRLQARRAKNRSANLGLAKTRNDRFEDFAQAADSIEWLEGSLYRPIFLGALPHLLVCLDHTWTIMMDEKAKVKRDARSSERHEKIEDVMKRQTKIKWVQIQRRRLLVIAQLTIAARWRLSTIIKRIRALQTELNETSDVHKRRDLKELEGYVRHVADILDEVPARAKEELDSDMTMASTWVTYVNESRKPKVDKAKPELNTEDLDYMYI